MSRLRLFLKRLWLTVFSAVVAAIAIAVFIALGFMLAVLGSALAWALAFVVVAGFTYLLLTDTPTKPPSK
jgi:uncharacterized membrane protein